MQTYFITATDTDAGKTTVSCALLKKFKHKKTMALKPLATGCNPKQLQPSDDLFRLHQHMNSPLSPEEMTHFHHTTPAAPSIANPDNPPKASEIIKFCRSSMQQQAADIMLIEGIGGWLCPINAQETMADVATSLNIPIILVVGIRLGCLNHALLTEFHVKQKAPLVGWIANYCIDNTTHHDDMVKLLQQHMTSPLLGTLHHNQEDIELNSQEILTSHRLKPPTPA